MAEKTKSNEKTLVEILRCVCHGINMQVQVGDDRLPSVFLAPSTESFYQVSVYEWIEEKGKGKPGKYPLKTSISLNDLPGYLAALKKSEEDKKNWVDEF